MALTDKLTAIANAIREKTGKAGGLTLATMPGEIAGIQTGGSGGDDLKYLIEKRVTDIKLPDDLAEIGPYAFYGCAQLALTKLPAGVTSIAQFAFNGCRSLALTELPAGVTSIDADAFSGCFKLALTSIPAGVTFIGGNAFGSCSGLTEITFEGKPTTIGYTAFNGCTGIRTVNVPWAEGEVANAPWGAVRATINYNYTGG